MRNCQQLIYGKVRSLGQCRVIHEPSVSDAGDVNGDGFDDLVIGVDGVDVDAEASFIVFGDTDIGSDDRFDPLNLNLDGSEGFVLKGIDPDDYSGNCVSNAGDFNGDSLDN